MSKEYENLFREFSKSIIPISNKITAYFSDPLNEPHNLSIELLQEMELLHMKLNQDLYRLRHGEFQEKLKMREIDLVEFDDLTKEIDNHLYRHI